MNAQKDLMKIVDQRINFCKYLNKRNGGNFVANFILTFVKKGKDPFSSCPVRKAKLSSQCLIFNEKIIKNILGLIPYQKRDSEH